ncbi:hypothetical protein ACFQRK_09380 [Parapedobacter sp. GCM10030251]|uniref:hypothetical protein n=1 Tax=Parapedobacter sp. GCM10030251 TaxID=3273419 RepID=UPI0036182EE6
MPEFLPPILRNDFAIIANFERRDLLAVALSYLFLPGKYLPILTFRDVAVFKDSPVDSPDIFAIQRRRAHEFGVFSNNALIEIGGCENLILLGLTSEQKSYLGYLHHYNVYEIDEADEIENYLGGFAALKDGHIECGIEQSNEGLLVALKNNNTLRIGSHNFELDIGKSGFGSVVIEDYLDADIVVSINYACSIEADILLVDGLEKEEDESISHLIEDWESGVTGAYEDICTKITARIDPQILNKSAFVTFFTRGLPYSVLQLECPISYVNLQHRPDFFILNGLLYEKTGCIGGAVVFSPGYFKDEETRSLISLLEFENFYVKAFLNDEASVYNLSTTIGHFPFDLLHICSHGGDVNGRYCKVDFFDKDGDKHTVEYDEVVSIPINPYYDSHGVKILWYFRKLNGMGWKCKELRDMDYPRELYALMVDKIREAGHRKKVQRLHEVERVRNSKHIKCHDFNYLAVFDQVSLDGVYPLVFNNTCWSWREVASAFLASGCRGYIGTLTSINTDIATAFAMAFYDEVFNNNLILAFHKAGKHQFAEEPSPYIFWGLHFSTIKNYRPVSYNARNIRSFLYRLRATLTEKLIRNEGSRELLKHQIFEVRMLIQSL